MLVAAVKLGCFEPPRFTSSLGVLDIHRRELPVSE